jgi:DNA-binding transcriptional LysR family regulator
LDVRDIELIRTVAESGTLSHASTALNVSQPTLSKRLARLEQVLGTTLFYRYARGLAPTDVARYILEKAAPLRAQISELERHVELMTQLERGQLRLGVGPIVEQILLPEVLEQFMEKTGQVRLSIITEDEDTLLSMLNASELDIIAGPFPSEKQDEGSLFSIPLISDQLIAVTRPDHPLSRSNPVSLDDLLEYSWVAPKPQGILQEIQGHPILQRMKIVSENYGILKTLTIRTDAVCAGPRAVFRDELKADKLVELEAELGLVWGSTLLTKHETYATPLARELVDTFQAVATYHDSTKA